MNTKHTPGPWEVDRFYWTLQRRLFGSDEPEVQLIARISETEDDEREANARLIAAAPDLLAACEELLDGMVKGEKHNTANVTLYAIGMIREAIRKAGGQQ